MTRKNLGAVASIGLVTLLYGASPALAQVAQAPNLGTAAPYTVLGTNVLPVVGTVTCTNTGPGSTINGRVGTTFTSITNTGCAISGPIDAPVANSVVNDFNTAFAAIDVQNPVCTGGIPIVSTTLAPGVYCSAAGTTLGAGVILTLNGTASDVWVFRVGTGGPSALTLTSAQVVMGGAALACNVYWKTSAGVALTDSTFNGTVLSGAAVTMTRGSWFGRDWAKTDATVTDAAPLTFAGCSGGSGGPPPPTPPPTATDLFIVKRHTGTFVVGTAAAYTITLQNAGTTASGGLITVTDILPAGLTFVSATGANSWTCNAVGQQVTCTTPASVPGTGILANPITITVMPTAAAVPTVTNIASVSGGNDANGTNNTTADITLVVNGVPTLPEWAMLMLVGLLAAAGAVALRARRA